MGFILNLKKKNSNMTKKYKVSTDGKVKVSINIPLKTLEKLDFFRKKDSQTRSSWITTAVLEKFAK
jgi:hypothetical protein